MWIKGGSAKSFLSIFIQRRAKVKDLNDIFTSVSEAEWLLDRSHDQSLLLVSGVRPCQYPPVHTAAVFCNSSLWNMLENKLNNLILMPLIHTVNYCIKSMTHCGGVV